MQPMHAGTLITWYHPAWRKSPTRCSLSRKTSKLRERNSCFHYDWLAPTASSLKQGMKTLLQSLRRLKTIKIYSC